MNHLSQFNEVLDYIEDQLICLKIKTNQENIKVAATLFVVAIDHAQGVKFLLQSKAYPSAFALLRIIFETYIRGMWIERCANKFQLNNFVDNDKIVTKKNKKLIFGDMALEVEKEHQFSEYFSEIKNYTWAGLNSLTHSGRIQLHNNFDGNSIKHCYNDKHVNEAINFTTMLVCMSFSALVDLATNTDGEEESKKLLSLIRPWAFNKSI